MSLPNLQALIRKEHFLSEQLLKIRRDIDDALEMELRELHRQITKGKQDK